MLSESPNILIRLQFYLYVFFYVPTGQAPAGIGFQVNRGYPYHGKSPKVRWIGSNYSRISFTFGGIFLGMDNLIVVLRLNKSGLSESKFIISLVRN
jgi:hypothetical protein